MKNKQCQVLGVFRDGKILYNISVNSAGHLDQFYGKSNSSPDIKDRDRVVNFLSERGIIKLPKIDDYGKVYSEQFPVYMNQEMW